MKKQATQRKRRGLLALVSAAAVVAAACALALPAPALAADQVIAHSVDSSGNRTDYTSVDAAKTAGYAGAVIVMDTDWNMGSMLEVADSKSLTIDMNGHYISNSEKSTTIFLNEHASLKLTSSAPAREFRYQGYNAESSSWREVFTTASGLVANVFGRANPGTGILAEKDTKLTLENVAVAGYCGSGISVTIGCIVNLTNATVCHNCTDNGAGISLGDSCTVNMNGSHVDDNVATELGGGFHAGSGNKINMENGSTVSRNRAKAGGGFYFGNSFFTLKSEDKTGVIEGNVTTNKDSTTLSHQLSGGGIHVDSSGGNNEGTIQGLTIKGNYSAYDGGGIELDQRWTTVRDCVITGNSAACDGGGVYVNGNNNTFTGCTVTGNYCDAGNGGFEGGGIFVSYHYDVSMYGKNIIKGNTRGKDTGNADDVFLSTVSGGTGKAYIKGSLDQGSAVGVRTGIEGDRRIAENFSCASKDGLFMDLGGYYVSYGTDNGGDAWQRHTTKEFSVKVNGKEVGRYRNGTSVTVSAAASQNGGAFCYWSASGTTGLYPVADYINDRTMRNSVLTFTMPQNDVSLGAAYANDVASATITCGAPVADMALPTGATLEFSDGSAGTTKVSASVSWYEVGADGEKTPAFGNAKKNTAYVASFSVARSPELACVFSGGIKDSDVTVKFTMLDESTTEGSGTQASVSETSGSLLVWSTAPKTGNSAFEAFTKNLSLLLKNRGLLGASEAAALADDDEAGADDDVIETVEVGCTYNEETEEVAITAPYVEGFNFCDWGDDDFSDEQTITIPVEQLEGVDSLEAYYTPVATKLEVALDAPVAGEELDTTCDEILVTAYDGSTVGFADALGTGAFEVAWSPEPEDGVAAYSTTYTAVIRICDGQGVEGLESVLAQNAEVTCNGAKASSAGFFVDSDGYLCLAVVLLPTADEETEPVDPDDPGKTDEDEKPGDSGKEEDANANKDQVNEQTATAVTTTVTTAKAAKAGTPSTGDVTFTAAGALLAASAICLAAAVFSRRNQH